MRHLQRTGDRRRGTRARLVRAVAVSASLALSTAGRPLAAQRSGQQTYASPEEAVAALVAAVRTNDSAAFATVLPDALEQFASNDDVQAGSKKLIEQRIVENESRAVTVCRLYVKAQLEYASKDRDDDGVLEYAQRILSTPGTRDGLYWPNNDMTAESPFGPSISLANAQGYSFRGTRDQPYQGYYYRVLVRQGASAPGGMKDYVLTNGNMTEGFGCVAYPSRWGVSGIRTFIVGPDGMVFEKDLGRATGLYASAMSEFDPDETWVEVKR